MVLEFGSETPAVVQVGQRVGVREPTQLMLSKHTVPRVFEHHHGPDPLIDTRAASVQLSPHVAAIASNQPRLVAQTIDPARQQELEFGLDPATVIRMQQGRDAPPRAGRCEDDAIAHTQHR